MLIEINVRTSGGPMSPFQDYQVFQKKLSFSSISTIVKGKFFLGHLECDDMAWINWPFLGPQKGKGQINLATPPFWFIFTFFFYFFFKL